MHATVPPTERSRPYALLLKFPPGIVSFAIVAVYVATSLSFLASAPAFRFAPATFSMWHADGDDAALIMPPLGLLLVILSLHVFNRMAAVWRAPAATPDQ
ncbi:MAG: sensor domain-containing protein [Acidobacteria bacterium]|nr:sensor domain-containing protein [Acidobacteriota bacterium]